ncbi:MAG: alkaline phosphatase family protein, partial [Candidatus Dormibacteraceae bacterium]
MTVRRLFRVATYGFSAVIASIAITGCGGSSTTPPGQNPGASGIKQIQHVVFIIKENRTFDNYFGTFSGADGATSGVMSNGQQVSLTHEADRLPHDICHLWKCAIRAIDDGKIDGFNIDGGRLAYTQFTESDIPNYFAYARQFVLADHMFSSLQGPSFPNHLYTIATQSGGVIDLPNPLPGPSGAWGCDDSPSVRVTVLSANGAETQQFPCFDFQTLGDRLQSAHVSWRYYAPGKGQSGYVWSAYDAINHIRNSSAWASQVVSDQQFVTDAANGNLPAVSWLTTSSEL